MANSKNTERLHTKVSKEVRNGIDSLIGQHINGVLCENIPDVIEQLIEFHKENKRSIIKDKDGKKVKSRSSEDVETRISSVVNAIMKHNDKAEPRKKWFISRSLLRNYTFSVGDKPLDNFLEKFKVKIDKHHNKHKIDVSINKKIRDKDEQKRGFVGKQVVLKDMYDIMEKEGLKDAIYKGLPFSDKKS